MQTDTHSPQTDEPSLDTAFRLLRHPRRRALVSALADREPPVQLSELAAAVAALELETDEPSHDIAEAPNDHDEAPDDPDEVPPGTAETVAATLHHVHLPKLADRDLVAYAVEEQTVTDESVEAVGPVSNLTDGFDC
jgi:hypothetical protein